LIGSHIEITKYDSPSSDNYITVARMLAGYVKKAGETYVFDTKVN